MCFACQNLELDHFETVPYPFENSLIGIGRQGVQTHSNRSEKSIVESECRQGNDFARQFGVQRQKIREYLAEFKRTNGKIALFGAGHLACTFVNAHGIAEDIEFIVDDNPNKKGLFMPGSKLPIKGSQALIEEGIKLCLLSLNPLGEESDGG
jgi:hypothetical protein